ncbi:MAG: tetratricopeptide repeat protein [Thermodesulfobacteriota bacterium]
MRRSIALLLLCCIAAAAAFAQEADPVRTEALAQEAFFAAQALEQKQEFARAIESYLAVAQEYPRSPFAGEAVLRSAVIYDDNLYDPPRAITYYREYLERYGGRQSRRADIRIKALARYANVDPLLYRQYRDILDHASENMAVARDRMDAFIQKNPSCPFLDEALLWLGNEYRGFKRGITDPSERDSIRRAMVYYQRIIKEFPGTESYLYALKNLGDCHRLLGDFRQGRRAYMEVMLKGGDFGRMLVGNQMTMLNMDMYRTRVLYGVILLFVGCVAGLFLLVDFRAADILPGLWAGLRKSLFFAPVAAILVFVTYLYTDATMSNIKGDEPWLVAVLAVIAMAGLMLNEVVVRADRRKRVKAGAYLPILAGLILCLVYLSYYFLDFLPYAERLFVSA